MSCGSCAVLQHGPDGSVFTTLTVFYGFWAFTNPHDSITQGDRQTEGCMDLIRVPKPSSAICKALPYLRMSSWFPALSWAQQLHCHGPVDLMDGKRRQLLLCDCLSLPISSGQAFQKQWKSICSLIAFIPLCKLQCAAIGDTKNIIFSKTLESGHFSLVDGKTWGRRQPPNMCRQLFLNLKHSIPLQCKTKCFIFKQTHTYFYTLLNSYQGMPALK